MAVGKLTRPESAPGEPSVAQKIAATFAAEMLDPGTTAAETEAFPLAWAEEDMLDHMRAHPELHFGSTSQKNRTRHELLKAVAETAPAAAPAPAAAEEATSEGSGLSKMARGLKERPEDLARLRAAVNELDAFEIEQAALAEIDSELEDAVDAWEWPEPEQDESEGGEQS